MAESRSLRLILERSRLHNYYFYIARPWLQQLSWLSAVQFKQQNYKRTHSLIHPNCTKTSSWTEPITLPANRYRLHPSKSSLSYCSWSP